MATWARHIEARVRILNSDAPPTPEQIVRAFMFMYGRIYGIYGAAILNDESRRAGEGPIIAIIAKLDCKTLSQSGIYDFNDMDALEETLFVDGQNAFVCENGETVILEPRPHQEGGLSFHSRDNLLMAMFRFSGRDAKGDKVPLSRNAVRYIRNVLVGELTVHSPCIRSALLGGWANAPRDKIVLFLEKDKLNAAEPIVQRRITASLSTLRLYFMEPDVHGALMVQFIFEHLK